MRTSIYAKILGIAIELILLMVVVAIASSFPVNGVGASATFLRPLVALRGLGRHRRGTASGP